MSRSFGRLDSALLNSMRLFLSAVVTVVYGFSDEFHQLYVPGRSADMYDLAADAAGALLFVLLAKIFFNNPVHPRDDTKS